MKKILSFIGIAAGVAVALIVSGCSKNNVKSSNVEETDHVTKDNASPSDNTDGAILKENLPENDDYPVAIYGMPPELNDQPVQDNQEADILKENPVDADQHIMALYGMPPELNDQPVGDDSQD